MSCGIDWADDHHEVAFVDEQGAVVTAERVEHTAAGLATTTKKYLYWPPRQ